MRLREWAQQLLDPDVTVQKPIAKKHSMDDSMYVMLIWQLLKAKTSTEQICVQACSKGTNVWRRGGGGGGRGRKKSQVWGDVTVTPCETPWKETFRLPHVGFLPLVTFA